MLFSDAGRQGIRYLYFDDEFPREFLSIALFTFSMCMTHSRCGFRTFQLGLFRVAVWFVIRHECVGGFRRAV